MSDPMLVVESLSAWYGAARILYDLNFNVGRGEVVALMGRNGAGKSTTMKAIMGLIADGDADSIRRNPQVQEVYLGTGKTYAAPT